MKQNIAAEFADLYYLREFDLLPERLGDYHDRMDEVQCRGLLKKRLAVQKPSRGSQGKRRHDRRLPHSLNQGADPGKHFVKYTDVAVADASVAQRLLTLTAEAAAVVICCNSILQKLQPVVTMFCCRSA